MSLIISSRLAAIPHYEPGLTTADVLARYGLEAAVRLASNESPYPPLEQVQAVLAAGIAGLNRYPDGAARALRREIADLHGLDLGQVVIGNGSCELLLLAGQAFLDPGTTLVHAVPSFGLYPHVAAAAGAAAIGVPLDDEGRNDLAAMAAAIDERTRLVIVCSPNNPTGAYVPAARIEEFLDGIPEDLPVLIDEAYYDFVTEADRGRALSQARTRAKPDGAPHLFQGARPVRASGRVRDGEPRVGGGPRPCPPAVQHVDHPRRRRRWRACVTPRPSIGGCRRPSPSARASVLPWNGWEYALRRARRTSYWLRRTRTTGSTSGCSPRGLSSGTARALGCPGTAARLDGYTGRERCVPRGVGDGARAHRARDRMQRGHSDKGQPTAMMIVMKQGATDEQVARVIERIERAGAMAHASRGEFVTVIGAIGDDRELVASMQLEGEPGVERVVPILKPYKLVSRDFRGPDATMEISGRRIGGENFCLIAGPCTVESREQTLTTAARRPGRRRGPAARRRLQAADLALQLPGAGAGGAARSWRRRAS